MRGEITTTRNLLQARPNSRIPAAGIPTSQRHASAYRAQVSITLRDPSSGYQRSFVVRQGFPANPTMSEIRKEASDIAFYIVESHRSPDAPAEPDYQISRMQLLNLTRRRN